MSFDEAKAPYFLIGMIFIMMNSIKKSLMRTREKKVISDQKNIDHVKAVNLSGKMQCY